MSEALTLKVRGISKRYGGVQALKSVDFDCSPGEVIGLMGDNGAGKSTLVCILCGAEQPDAGTIEFNGQEVSFRGPQHAAELGISVVYQDLALVGLMDVARNVFLGHEPTRFGFVQIRKMRKEAGEILSNLKIRISSTRLAVESLSGGQRQSIAIARAVRLGGSLVLLDEPTAALGPEQQANVLRIISELKNEGRTIIVISHNIDHILAVSDRIMVMRAGELAGVRDTKTTSAQEIVGLIVGDQRMVKENLIKSGSLGFGGNNVE
jgi:ABC-type sugar transport system ATPase subunit